MKYSLIINAGSSTYKYAIFLGKKKVASYLYQKEGKFFTYKKLGGSKEVISEITFEKSLYDLKSREPEIFSQVEKLAFRVVHGGDFFHKPTLITKSVLKKLSRLNRLAPLHNPPAMKVLRQSQKLFPKKEKLLIFDTAFHHDLPSINRDYALPKVIIKKMEIRRYGFHGIICSSLVTQMGWRLPKRTVICHLGSGCSVTAVLNGKSVDTSMGFTPLEGLIMATRAGDLDPGLILELQRKIGAEKTDHLLNKESGLQALVGTSDMREILLRAKKGNVEDQAIELFCQKAAKHIAAASISLGGIDTILFSGGIGENASLIRQKICDYLKPLGVRADPRKNFHAKPKKKWNRLFSKVKLRYLHADEDTEMNRILQKKPI